MSSEAVRTISNRSTCSPPSPSTRYSVPPSARVIVFTASRIFSSSALRFFSSESAAPISFSCSSRRKRPAGEPSSCRSASRPTATRLGMVLIGVPPCGSGPSRALLDADRADLGHVGDPLHHLLDAVHLQRAHAFLERGREHLGHARVLLDVLLDRVGADQELVQAEPALVAGVAAGVAARLLVEGELPLLVGVSLRELLVHALVRRLRVLLEFG